jgi:hypothetical protein
MNKQTVIANLRAEIALSEELQGFFEQFENQDNAWFAKDGGDLFLSEFGFEWNNNFAEVAQELFDQHFMSLGVREDQLPKVKVTDSRRGSWVMEAALTVFGTVGTTYTILKAIAELPKLADGLEEAKKRLQKELTQRFKKRIPERIEPVLTNSGISATLPPSVKRNPVSVTCSIDARPLRALTPDTVKSHSIHLSVGVSRSALSIENLGEKNIENLRIGLFKATEQQHNWSFADAYSRTVPRLSSRQSISLGISDFCSESNRQPLDLTDSVPLFVDCWLQDNAGIYLFNFYLE